MRILIVDDVQENRYMLATLLACHGYETAAVANGVEALSAAHAAPPDLLVTDLMMPDMDGFELCRRWKQDDRLRHVPILVYTATYTDPQDERLVRTLGADRFLVKPQRPERLIEVVQELLEATTRDPSSVRPGAPDEAALLQLHNEALLRKLQQKILVLEHEIAEGRRLEAERTRLEAALRQQQKLEAIGTLASGVAHEINTPLNVILNYGQLLHEEAGLPAHVQEYAGEIVRESERVAAIVKNLLSFSRQDRDAYGRGHVEDIVGRTLSLVGSLLRRDRIAVDCDLARPLPPVRCRPQQIQQVLMNLVTNARDALNERYPEAADDKRIRIAASAIDRDGATWVRLTVEDRGAGIAPELAERVFDPFFTTKERDKGTGLGLSISYGIVTEHGGSIGFESAPGRGTSFHVDLPADEAGAVPLPGQD